MEKAEEIPPVIEHPSKPPESAPPAEEGPAKNKSALRMFSKEHSPLERKELAAELWAKRREYFDTQKSHKQLFDNLTEQARQKELQTTEVVRRLTEIRKILQERKASRFKALIGFFEIKKLGIETEDLEERGQKLAAAQEALQAAINDLEQESKDTTLLEEAREKIDGFYANQERAWVKHQESERARDVQNFATEHDVYLIHAIPDLMAPSTNSLLRQGVTFEEKAAILALEPTLSTSTIKEGDGYDNMWDSQGVILSRGRVIAASAGDASTVASSLRRRSEGDADSDQIAQSIRRAIEERPKNGPKAYNELVVEQPEVAAFFISFDPSPGKQQKMSLERVENMAVRAGVPVYGLLAGRLHELEKIKTKIDDRFSPNYGKEVEKTVLGRVISRQEILAAKTMSSDKKAALAETALENSAFKIGGPELGQLKTRYEGRMEYLKLADIERFQSKPRLPERYSGSYITVSIFSGFTENQGPMFDTVEISKDDEIKVLTTIRRPDGAETKIIDLNGILYQIDKLAPHSQEEPDFRYSLSRFEEHSDAENNYIHIGNPSGNFIISEPITRENFTKVIADDVVASIEKELAAAIAEGNTRKEKESRASLKEVGYYLYGIGEQADQFGDIEVRERAWQAAERMVPLTTIREVMARRLNRNEGYRITKEELS